MELLAHCRQPEGYVINMYDITVWSITLAGLTTVKDNLAN